MESIDALETQFQDLEVNILFSIEFNQYLLNSQLATL